MFEVKFSNNAEKLIRKSDVKLRARLQELFQKIMYNPIPAKEYDLKKISGEKDTYRIRLSSYRIIYCVYWEEKTVRVLKIERRKDSTYKF